MLRWLGITAAVSAITLLLCEVALRIYNPIYVPIRADAIQLPVNRTFTQVNLNNKDVDRELVNSYNGIGLRGPEFPSDPGSRLKVFTVGGSTTACVTLTDGRTWPDIVLKDLSGRFGNRVWLNNAGMDGHSTFGHMVLLRSHLAKFSPDYVVYLIGINDMGREDLNGYDSQMLLEGQSLRNKVIAASELLSTAQTLYRAYKAFDMGLNHAVDHDLTKIPRVSRATFDSARYVSDHRDRYVPAYERRVRDLVESTIAMGASPILVTQPGMMGRGIDPATGVQLDDLDYDMSGVPSSAVWDALELYNDVVRRVAVEYDVPMIDAARQMPKDSRLYFDWIHYSILGAERMADIVSRELGRIVAVRLEEAATKGNDASDQPT